MNKLKLMPTYPLQNKLCSLNEGDELYELHGFFNSLDNKFNELENNYNIHLSSVECMALHTKDNNTKIKTLMKVGYVEYEDIEYPEDCINNSVDICIADRINTDDASNKYFITRYKEDVSFKDGVSIPGKSELLQSSFSILPEDKDITIVDILSALSTSKKQPKIYNANNTELYDDTMRVNVIVGLNNYNITISTDIINTVIVKDIEISGYENAKLVDIFDTTYHKYKLIERYIFPQNSYKYFYMDLNTGNIQIYYFHPSVGGNKSIRIDKNSDDIFNYYDCIGKNTDKIQVNNLLYNKFDPFNCLYGEEYVPGDDYYYMINSSTYINNNAYICNILFISDDGKLKKDCCVMNQIN